MTLSRLDQAIAVLDQGLRSVHSSATARRASPADAVADSTKLSPEDRAESARLMRVNRAGEIAAQALYSAQAVFARDSATAAHLRAAAAEENDHLAWCTRRIDELGGRRSLLDPCWYLASAAIGTLAGLSGDSASLGFVAETERQVEAHLNDHMRRLPEQDRKSRAVLEQMASDEARHGVEATRAGGRGIREPIRSFMAIGGGLLRRLAYRL